MEIFCVLAAIFSAQFVHLRCAAKQAKFTRPGGFKSCTIP